MKIFPEIDNTFSTTTYYLIIIIAFVHVIGYIDLMRWFDFTGIGKEARRVQSKYGRIGIILLNASALLLFIIIALIYNNKDLSKFLFITSLFTIIVFLIRGLFGYAMVIKGITGSTTTFWSLLFSSTALLVGILGAIGLKEGL